MFASWADWLNVTCFSRERDGFHVNYLLCQWLALQDFDSPLDHA